MQFIITLSLSLFLAYNSYCQVGINQNKPSQPLEVGGIIFTNSGGVMFPDSTLQTTAALNAEQSFANRAGCPGYMDITSIVGPIADGPFREQFEFHNFYWGMERSVTGDVGGSRSRSTPNIDQICVSLEMGEGMETIYTKLVTGVILEEIKLTFPTYPQCDDRGTDMQIKGQICALTNFTPVMEYLGEGMYSQRYELCFDAVTYCIQVGKRTEQCFDQTTQN